MIGNQLVHNSENNSIQISQFNYELEKGIMLGSGFVFIEEDNKEAEVEISEPKTLGSENQKEENT